ncbi:MAG: DNA polymerase III subunit chi [Thiobacillaceae bacterium]
MTEVSFYTFADDKLAVARKLAAKAVACDLRVMIYTPDTALAEAVDRMLWTTPVQGFLPHCRDSHRLAADTPVLIGENADALSQADVMINLHHERPPAFSRFQRLLEIVSTDTEDVEQGRLRYRFYRERGYALTTVDLRNAA